MKPRPAARQQCDHTRELRGGHGGFLHGGRESARCQSCAGERKGQIDVPDSQPPGCGTKAEFAASAAAALRARRKGTWPNFIATSFQRAS